MSLISSNDNQSSNMKPEKDLLTNDLSPIQAISKDYSASYDYANAWETFEDYVAGEHLVHQANVMGRNYWSTWAGEPGGDEDPLVSNAIARSGSNAVLIENMNDAVLQFGNLTSGKWNVSFFINVPEGFCGYFNLLQDFDGDNSQWGMQAFFDAGGLGSVDAGEEGAASFVFTHDDWTFVNVVVDLDQDSARMFVDDMFVVDWKWSSGTFGTGSLNQLAALNLYAWSEDTSPKAYFDDINCEVYAEPLLFEPFEAYIENDFLVQQAEFMGNSWWQTWSNDPGSSEDPKVSTDHAFIGDKSVVIEGSNDAICLFGDITSGKYLLELAAYIPDGYTGYFNLLQEFAGSNSQWGLQVYFDADGTGIVDAGGEGAGSFDFAYDTWLQMRIVIDINLDWAELYVDGHNVVQWKWSRGALGTGDLKKLNAMNLYAWDETGVPKVYYDNIRFTEYNDLVPPTNLFASVDDNDVTLTWNPPFPPAPHGFLGYIVYRDSKVIIQEITETSYTDIDLLPGDYSYDVKAIYTEGYSNGAGPVEVSIEGGTSRNFVLLEIGTGTWCEYCPGAAMGADDLRNNGQNVAVIEYHSGDDYETSESDFRLNTYYGITAYPTAWFDGIISYEGGNTTSSLYETYLAFYETRASKVSLFELSVVPEYTGNSTFDFVVTAENIYQYPGQDIVLHAVAVESHVPVNWFMMDEINYVCRKMLPDHMGTSLDFSTQSLYEVEMVLNWNGWNIDNMGLVVFLQDNDTREILQTTMIDDLGVYVGIDDPELATEISIFPNPATNLVNVATGANLQEVRILNNSGQLVFNQQVDEQSLHVNTSNLQAGVYFIEIRTSAGVITEKLVIR